MWVNTKSGCVRSLAIKFLYILMRSKMSVVP